MVAAETKVDPRVEVVVAATIVAAPKDDLQEGGPLADDLRAGGRLLVVQIAQAARTAAAVRIGQLVQTARAAASVVAVPSVQAVPIVQGAQSVGADLIVPVLLATQKAEMRARRATTRDAVALVSGLNRVLRRAAIVMAALKSQKIVTHSTSGQFERDTMILSYQSR